MVDLKLSLLAIILLASASFATDISACAPITVPDNYVLTTSISTTGVGGETCIAIQTSDIYLDCGGYSINGIGTGDFGVTATSVNNITLHNCEITSNDNAVDFTGVTNSQIEYADISSATDYALRLTSSDYVNISHVNMISQANAHSASLHSTSNIIFYEDTITSIDSIGISMYQSLGIQILNTTINSAAIGAFYMEDVENSIFLENHIFADNWVYATGTIANNTFNDSAIGNDWNLADSTPASSLYDITCSGGAPCWADGGTSLPFGTANTPTEWTGFSEDWHPYVASGICTGGVISSLPATLDCPNSIYTSDSDLTSGSDGIAIEANNITLDCAGFSLMGDGISYGIYTEYNDAKVSNCTISNFETCISTQGSYGLYLENNCSTETWIYNSGDDNFFNDSIVGNIYYSANGTPASAFCNITSSTNSWADGGADIPFYDGRGCLMTDGNALTHDGNWDTYGDVSTNPSTAFLYINYTIPIWATDNEGLNRYYWKTGNDYRFIGIPSTCVSGFSTLQIEVTSTLDEDGSTITVYCNDGEGFIYLDESYGTNKFYEGSAFFRDDDNVVSCFSETVPPSESGSICEGTPAYYATNWDGSSRWIGNGEDWHPFVAYYVPPPPPVFHSICSNEQCVLTLGAGTDECYIDAQCANQNLIFNFSNYSTPSNITGFDKAFDYSGAITNQIIGYPAFAPLVLGLFFLGFFVVGSRYTQERALTFALFLTTIAAFIMVAGHFLDPMWLILSILGLIAAVFFLNRVG